MFGWLARFCYLLLAISIVFVKSQSIRLLLTSILVPDLHAKIIKFLDDIVPMRFFFLHFFPIDQNERARKISSLGIKNEQNSFHFCTHAMATLDEKMLHLLCSPSITINLVVCIVYFTLVFDNFSIRCFSFYYSSLYIRFVSFSLFQRLSVSIAFDRFLF